MSKYWLKVNNQATKPMSLFEQVLPNDFYLKENLLGSLL